MKKNKTDNDYNAEITKKELEILGNKIEGVRADGGDDRMLQDHNNEIDFAGKNLDIPGRNLSNNTSKKSLKDEENQLYSQGGSGNEDLERKTNHIE